MPAWLSSVATKTKKWAELLWKFFAGGIIVLVGFSANFVDWKRPDISVEITGIEQITSVAIDITATPDFVGLRKLLNDPLGLNNRQDKKYTYEDMRQEIERAKQRLSDNRNELARLRTRIQDSPDRTKGRNKESGETIVPIEFMDDDTISQLSSMKLREYFEGREKNLRERETLINAADTEAKSYKARTEKTDARIVVTAAISNSGAGGTTLKPQALLRTDLGQGNYLDISLKMINYGSGISEIKSQGTSVLSFESPSISRMSPEDQERFLNFFKNTSPTNLFISDVRGEYYKSNTIPFAQGIYEQKIYDGLKAYATVHRN